MTTLGWLGMYLFGLTSYQPPFTMLERLIGTTTKNSEAIIKTFNFIQYFQGVCNYLIFYRYKPSKKLDNV